MNLRQPTPAASQDVEILVPSIFGRLAYRVLRDAGYDPRGRGGRCNGWTPGFPHPTVMWTVRRCDAVAAARLLDERLHHEVWVYYGGRSAVGTRNEVCS